MRHQGPRVVTDDPARGGPASEDLPPPRASKITPESLEEFRLQLSTGSEDTVNPKTWSGSLPNQRGTAPMLRVPHYECAPGFLGACLTGSGRARSSTSRCLLALRVGWNYRGVSGTNAK